jgi:hypothetical protein
MVKWFNFSNTICRLQLISPSVKKQKQKNTNILVTASTNVGQLGKLRRYLLRRQRVQRPSDNHQNSQR